MKVTRQQFKFPKRSAVARDFENHFKFDFTKLTPCLIFSCAALLAACSSGSSNFSDPSKPETAGSVNASTSGTNPAQILPPSFTGAGNTSILDGTVSSPVGTIASGTGGSIAIAGPATVASPPAEQPITEKSAFRLLQQASFGPTEAGLIEAKTKGPRRWLAEQFAMPISILGFRDRDDIHRWSDKNNDFCSQYPAGSERDNCWRDWYSTDPIKLDFFKQASLGTDQLRQRVGFALSQIVVVSEVEVSGTYGLSDYFQTLREKAFGNYRDVLMTAITHPVMGEYLNMVNNDAADPNENFARELLQLFSVGTCELNLDGSLKGGACKATYDNAMVREYAYALTGWTYPAGGVNPWCTTPCDWKNPKYLKGSMVSVAAQHDTRAHTLLAGTVLNTGNSAPQALNMVLDSLMNHPNVAPFVAKRLIQALVSSNPSPAYISRVATAFNAGKFENFGAGTKGDLKATLAAILLDADARDDASAVADNSGLLREPVVKMVSAVRAMNGYTDGERMGRYGWGTSLSQPLFNSPSVFNFYAPDYPLPGVAGMDGPQFQISNANTTIGWFNFANELIYWWYGKGAGLAAKADMVGTTGTALNYSVFEADAADPVKLIDRMDRLFTGGTLSANAKASLAAALSAYTDKDTWLADANNQSSWKRERVKTAAYLFISSPGFQVQK